MNAKVIPIDAKQQAVWADYIACRDRAEASRSMDDGIAAGRAWARWLALFEPNKRPAE